ncbi:MAG TPA: DinB family protein [Acidimicrobiia bacterium]|nr:DinB family protein [Acidimicrobiia bacterium]
MSRNKTHLKRYLQSGRDALVWKLDGLSEYDIRRPLVPTGTNLLGLIKHLACVEYGYFGDTFDRPYDDALPWWDDDAEPNADMWATPDESRADIVDLYRRAWVHADATIDALDLDAVGNVPWWKSDRREVSLHQILIHVIAETHRHAGHADIVRELIDGAVGLRQGVSNLPDADPEWWDQYRQRLEDAARRADA